MKIKIISDKNSFESIKSFLKILGVNANVDDKVLKGDEYIIFKYEDSKIKNILNSSEGKKISYGFSDKADFFASDQIDTENGINFKLNYEGNSVPVWVKGCDKSFILDILAAICAGIVSGMNIIEMSEKLK